MKKLILLIFMLISLIGCSSLVFANSSDPVIAGDVEQEEINDKSNLEDSSLENDISGEMSPAGEEIIGAVSKKDKRIAELTVKYNDETLGIVAYYLEVVRYYSTPIFFVFLTIGAFNYFIVGNKKLDKKEQGFGWITGCMIGWVFFQCLPLIFTLFAL